MYNYNFSKVKHINEKFYAIAGVLSKRKLKLWRLFLTESAYAASKAAIAKAFEGLALTYHNTNLEFSVIYAGPVATDGLKGNLPFAWSPRKMAKYMLKKAVKGKSRIHNSLFYSMLSHFLKVLPTKYTMKILGRL